MSTVASDLEIGERLRYGASFASVPRTWGRGRYRCVRHLAEGGQGYVELARDEWSNALVVVKGAWWGGRDHDINPEYARTQYEKRSIDVEDAVAVQAALGEITHGVPALVDVVYGPSPTRHDHNALVTGGNEREVERYNREAFIVMQFIGDIGQMVPTTLDSRVTESGPLNARQVVELADQISATLEAMHTIRPQRLYQHEERIRGYWVHGDVKPENILVAGDPPRYSLVDLSTAAIVEPSAKVMPTTATPGYAPPGAEPLSPQYDLHCLAATLLFALTGDRPDDWLGGATEARSAADAAGSRADAEARDEKLRQLRGELAARRVHPMLIRLITDCLPADPRFRLGTATVLRAEIAAVRTALVAREVLSDEEPQP